MASTFKVVFLELGFGVYTRIYVYDCKLDVSSVELFGADNAANLLCCAQTSLSAAIVPVFNGASKARAHSYTSLRRDSPFCTYLLCTIILH